MPRPRHRLDALAFGLLALGGLLTVAITTYRPLTDQANWLGELGDVVAAALVDALGVGVAVFLVGWFVWVGLYVAKRGWVRLAVRGAGWLILTVCGSVAADWLAGWFTGVPVSAYGKGGSIGAWGRFQSQDHLTAPLPIVALVGVTILGGVLAMDGVFRVLLRSLWFGLTRLARGAKRGNELVAAGSDFVLQGLGVVGKGIAGAAAKATASKPQPAFEAVPLVTVPEPTPATPLEELPIQRYTDLPPDSDPVPISRHTELPTDSVSESVADPFPEPNLVDTPPALRIIRPDDDCNPDPADNLTPKPDSPIGYTLPSLSLLAEPDPFPMEDHEQKLRDCAALLEKTFTDFRLNIKVVGIHTGPVITQYEVALETGLRLNKVTALADDLALNLGVPSVRIVAPLPNRTTVGIEVPNDHRQTVRMKELIQATVAKTAKFKLPVFLGKDVEGRPLVYDMAAMPHLLIAGRTGTGKSVCLNAIIHSFLLSRTPEECRLILIDPKKVEFNDYARIPHLMHPVVTDDKKAEAILAWALDKMQERYDLFQRARVRNIASYNDLSREEKLRRIDPQNEDERRAIPARLPYIVLVIDEVGDLLLVMKKEVESHIIRLAQLSRAAGIHLILATQKPTVDVITGLIKSNLPARICFQVASRADSAVVLDEKGAERLLGMGDMLFLQPGTSTIIRGQGTYLDDREIERVTGELAQYEPNFESELLNLKTNDRGANGDLGEKLRERDPMYEQAIEIVIREQRGSTSLLQRALGIGYGRASRLIDFMAEDGIVGAYNGSNARDVLVSNEEWSSRRNRA
jgi:S-DNA-T family DNA segregation ATPase FtsK/SpoIIIE